MISFLPYLPSAFFSEVTVFLLKSKPLTETTSLPFSSLPKSTVSPFSACGISKVPSPFFAAVLIIMSFSLVPAGSLKLSDIISLITVSLSRLIVGSVIVLEISWKILPRPSLSLAVR